MYEKHTFTVQSISRVPTLTSTGETVFNIDTVCKSVAVVKLQITFINIYHKDFEDNFQSVPKWLTRGIVAIDISRGVVTASHSFTCFLAGHIAPTLVNTIKRDETGLICGNVLVIYA